NLLFAYRWLLLECKREFPFSDALRVLEVMWSALPVETEPPLLSEIPLLATLDSNEKLCFTCTSSRSASPINYSIRRAISCPDLRLSVQQSTLQGMDRYLSRFDDNSTHHLLNISWPNITRPVTKYRRQHIKYVADDYSYSCMSSLQTPSQSQQQQLQQQLQHQRSFENSFSISELSELECDTMNQAVTATQLAWINRLPS
ncbi:unnamed protein product, partial [Didymodactylos carnosus]